MASWPGKTIDVGSGRLFVRFTTIVCPSFAHSTGPGLLEVAVVGASASRSST